MKTKKEVFNMCNNCFGGNGCTWIIILILILVCCGGCGFSGNSANPGWASDNRCGGGG